MTLLHVQDLHLHYGLSPVLRGVSLSVEAGEVVSLLGRNGAGRSSLLGALMGLLPAQGSCQFAGRECLGLRPFEMARLGMGLVPETRDVFPSLTVHQNLLLGQKPGRKPGLQTGPRAACWTIPDMYERFPPLSARQHTLAGVLSGGEQQMLSLCRTLLGHPRLVLVDEPTEGLAPQLVLQVGEFLREVRDQGVAVLLVEQKLQLALSVASRCLVLGHGRIVFDGSPQALRADVATLQTWLAV